MGLSALTGQRLVALRDGDGRPRAGVVREQSIEVLDAAAPVDVLRRGRLGESVASVALLDPDACAVPAPWRIAVPVRAPETWAAGVTYERSRSARVHESQVLDVYDRVYEDARPELFLKDAGGRRTVGPGEPIAARRDACWTVPEPELAVVLGAGAPIALTIANDVSSRDIEGANPLYLPQAKIYGRACALGPALLVPEDFEAGWEIRCRILDAGGATVFEGETSTDAMRRSIPELIEYLFRDNPVPEGSVLLTGTGLVPDDDVTLTAGFQVEIAIPGIGVLRNPVAGSTAHEED